uniref:helix-turn-helix domain-containing protein n=1 Tax=Pseudothauera nasutitermitis TaxID=2565930 RepID=UPI001B3B2348
MAALHKRGITLRTLTKEHGLKDSSTLSKATPQSYPAGERRRRMPQVCPCRRGSRPGITPRHA